MPRAQLVVALALAASAALAGCTGPEPMPTPTATMPAPSGDGILRIGTVFSTSGGDAVAAAQTAAVNAAVREIGMSAGAIPVEVINRNGGTAGDGLAEAAMADLLARGVDAIIGPSSAEVAAIVVPLAVSAGIPVISASATGDRPAGSSPGYWRVIPSLRQQAADLAAALDAPEVALLRADDAEGAAWAAGLAPATDVVVGADPAADAATIAGAEPDAVVVSTVDAGDATAAALSALLAAGIPADRLWITGRSLASYPAVGAALEGAEGMSWGSTLDAGFVDRVRLEDPGLAASQYVAEAYDAVMLVALAAALAGDDGAASIAATLSSVPDAGIPCSSYGACLDVLATQTDIAYTGPSGPFRFDDAGDRVGSSSLRYLYDATGSLTLAEPPQ
ncbi:MAG: ABC transporter substrate-binding protein [Microbacteriaceae bacterium]